MFEANLRTRDRSGHAATFRTISDHLSDQPSVGPTARSLIVLLTETMKQFDSSVFDGPILGIISRVFDVRRYFLDKYCFSSSMFDHQFLQKLEFRLFVLKLYDFPSLGCCPAGGVDFE